MSVELLPTPEAVIVADAEIGESPVLDRRTGRLAWVDITQGQLHQTDLTTGHTDSVRFDTLVGAAVPRERESGFVLAVAEGLAVWTPEDGFDLVDPCLPEPHLRFNDAKCDSHGRLWAGTNHLEFVTGHGKLRVWDGTGPSQVRAQDLTLPNGLGWSPDDRTMYLADSYEHVLLRADFDPGTGELGGVTTLCRVEGGYPDGLAVDVDGNIWIAVWGGWQVRRIGSDGQLTGIVRMPVAQPSSCAISGDGVLYITSATSGLSPAARIEQPLAGSVFALDIGIPGVPVSAFRG